MVMFLTPYLFVPLKLTHGREFVATYWPQSGTPGNKVRNMFDRIKAAEDALIKDTKDASPDSGTPKVIRATNGVVI